ncbi:molybdopterin-dependent oxidoreductase [Photobacterium sagamiensis]|uniref:xanthine dehydrogenase family protein molybdopterin-binding subunit n=1 Tax=Photobacterium sagamiensis TaxID=2910241 RepID=UPI003D14CF0F
MSEFSVIGKNVPKDDAVEKVTGQAIYAADIKMPGMLYGKIVRCMQYAHARVTRLDISEALQVPGVVKILRPEDVTAKTYNTSAIDITQSEKMAEVMGDLEDQHIFTHYVRHQGDAICGVIAKSEAIAERAAAKIKVEYEPLPVIMTPADASKEGAPQLSPHKPGNMAFQLPESLFPDNSYGWGDTASLMKEADVIIEDTFYVNKQKQCQMEPHSYVAHYDMRGRLNCWSSGQMPKLSQVMLSELFELPMSRVKIHQTMVGGGFGGRLGLVFEPETCAMALAVPGRPVKVQSLREEDWVASESRHAGDYWMKLGFKKDGTPVACEAKFKSNTGAYFTHASGVGFTTGAWLAGMYNFGALKYQSEAYFTNQAPAGAFRGFGNPQTNFVLEQMVDRACAQLNIDPVDWRLKWGKGVGDDSWILGVPYESCQLPECIKQGAEAIGWAEKREKYANQTGTKRRGVGVAVVNHTSGAAGMILEHTVCTVMLNEDASVIVSTACSDLGQGANTVLHQMAAESLGLPMEDVYVKTGDTDSNGFDIGAHASRTTFVGGRALLSACEDVKRQLLERASHALDADVDELEMVNKQIFVKYAPERTIDVATIAYQGIYQPIDPATGKPEGIPGQIIGMSSHHETKSSPPFSATFIDLEVDIETGEITLHDMVLTHDIGRVLHPAMCEGQMHGGAQQGLGMVLTEETYYDANGLCINNGFTDYKLLGSSDMPNTRVIFVEEPDAYGPFGAKGVGESSVVSPVGATANAVFHALGIQITEAPLTPEKVLKAIQQSGLTFD